MVRESILASRMFRAAGLSQARVMVHDQVPYTICLSTDYLWDSCSPNKDVVTEVKQYLVEKLWLTKDGKWDKFGGAKTNEKLFATRRIGSSKDKTFRFFSRLFNTVLECLRQSERGTPVEEMVHAVYVEPKSTSNRPDAFLRMVTETPLTHGKLRWRDLTCPFEYKFGDGNAVDNDVKAVWCLHHIMRSDPRRMFSFGSTVYGTKFRIWLMCRAACFTFTPFDWFEDPDSLIKFFVILATSSRADLGFDTNIERAGETDFDLQFTINGREYRTSNLLYDIGADTPTGRGTWVFEVVDEETKEVRVIKDCWVEDSPGKQMEHEIIAGIKHGMNSEEFREHFIDICGHRKTDASGGFGKICKILETETFVEKEFEPSLIVPASGAQRPTCTDRRAGDSIADQHHRLRSTEGKRVPENPPHPRFRYQVVYDEKGTSLFEVTSFDDGFLHIGQAAEALHCLHKAGWVHKDFSPGNVIAVKGKAKISNLEFAKQRVAGELERLTTPGNASSAARKDVRTGTLYFTAIEVVAEEYLFRPLGHTASIPRTFLHNPLHDYESVWWTAVWFIFSSKPKGVLEDVMKEAQDVVYKDRGQTFGPGPIERACTLLPEVLQPLGAVLVEMMGILLGAYQNFEKDFDGSKVLLVFPELRRCLQLLVNQARGLDVAPPAILRKLNKEDIKQLDTVKGQGDQEEMEKGKGVGGQFIDPDNPFLSRQEGSVVLGKRPLVGSPPKAGPLPRADHALKKKRFKEGSV